MDVTRGLLTLLVIMLAVYMVLSPVVAAPLYKGMLFQPDKYPLGQYDVGVINGCRHTEHIMVTADGLKLHGWYFELPQAPKVILLSHGNAGNISNRQALIAGLLSAGASVFVYDYRGYGKSEGDPSLPGVCEDSRTAYAYLTHDLQVKPSRLVLYGESLGAAITCRLLKTVTCAGVILQSGFSSLKQAGVEQLGFLRCYPNFLFPQPDLDNVAILKKNHPPLLLLHGDLDGVLPFSHAQELYRQASPPKLLVKIPGAAHSNLCEFALYKESIEQFLASI
jgi:uncharacterized protein